MLQQSLLFIEDDGCEPEFEHFHSLGNDLFLDLRNGPKGEAIIYRQGCVIRFVNLLGQGDEKAVCGRGGK